MKTCYECGQQALPGHSVATYSLTFENKQRIAGDYDAEHVEWKEHELCDACLWRDPYRIPVRDEPSQEVAVVLSLREQGYADINGMPLITDEDHPKDTLFLQIPRGLRPGQAVGDVPAAKRVGFNHIDLHESDGRMQAWLSESIWHEYVDYCQSCNRAFAVDEEQRYFLDAEVACPDCYFQMIFGLNFDWTDEAQKFWHVVTHNRADLREQISEIFFRQSPYVHFDYEKLNEKPAWLMDAASGWVGAIDDMNHALALDEMEEAIRLHLANGPVRFCIVLDRSTHNVCSLGWQLLIDLRVGQAV